jgi:crotonobetainyl-CoA:carnitine CoA-transferase CaiB-like acyl-CoA transferase
MTAEGSGDRPFGGVEVVEFGQFIAAPFCAQLLAQGGAHVIKVEPLEGDPVRQLAPLAPGETRHFISRNRGKHALPLELRRPAARRIMDALLARADVVLTNFRPGLAAEMGLDHASLAERYPRLVVGNVSAFGRRGPDAALAGMDTVVQARSGFMASCGRLDDGIPAASDAPAIDYMCAMTLAFGIASALLRRAHTGRGGEVDVTLLMAGLTLQNNVMVRVAAVDGPVHAGRLERLNQLRSAGAPHAEQQAILPSRLTASMNRVYYRTYRTKDSTIAVACVSPGLQRALMDALGLSDPAHERPLPDVAAETAHYAEFGERVEARFASRTTAAWKAALDAHGVPASGVRFPQEMLDDEQALANGMFHDLEHPALGTVRVLAPPLSMDAGGFQPPPVTAPLGSETRAILGRLGFSPGEIDGFIRDGVTLEQRIDSR